uniref:Derlin n=2 Tax=Chromera velia TaxID=505693 RepID=W8P5B9_9ALVE|nr:chloroplast Der1 [Chromera velia]|eukprot:Cvel_23890.t1-p1 / transcript=Cvel_23890.t1 / gene=Cvel_23890 / organism=Chromera_velia_CCMP2878 / gene_product=Derlin-2, putative / transcript_product=Derlin-2, putative / location=Cvel_scaffold2517:5150-8225(+) / protein_length=332 / sequence_SO=supercontig / SO=protein_coding / is_pseudo=false
MKETAGVRRRALVVCVWLCCVVACSCSSSGLSPSTLSGRGRRRQEGVLPSECCSSSSPSLQSASLPAVLRLRGGAGDGEEGDAWGDEGVDGFDDEHDDEDEETFTDYGGQSPAEKALDALKKMPPITKGYLLLSTALCLAVYSMNDNVWPQSLKLNWQRVFRWGELWRVVTPFFYLGSMGFSYYLNVAFVNQYMGSLEKIQYKSPEEFAVMVLFAAVFLLGASPAMGVPNEMLGHNLATFMLYVWSRTYEGLEVNLFNYMSVRAEYLPWLFLAQSWLLEGQNPAFELMGIAAGWVYHWLKGRRILRAPRFLRRLFEKEAVQREYARFAEEFE